MSIPRELLKKIRKIEIFTSKLVNDQLAGQYQSVFKGRGMAFSEVRQYQPGDDVRLIDWNVSARMNEPYVKIFVEEREMTVILLVDMSASGRFGSPPDPPDHAHNRRYLHRMSSRAPALPALRTSMSPCAPAHPSRSSCGQVRRSRKSPGASFHDDLAACSRREPPHHPAGSCRLYGNRSKVNLFS